MPTARAPRAAQTTQLPVVVPGPTKVDDGAKPSVVETVARKAGATITKAVRQEEPQTLAKMALAAITPKLIEGAIRFAIRNPVIAMVGAVAITGMVLATSDRRA